MIVPHALEARIWATASVSRGCGPCGGGGANYFRPPRARDGIDPHCRRGAVVGAEAAHVGGLQRLAILSRREAVDGVRARPCVHAIQRVEQLRAEAVNVVLHR